MKGWKQMGPSRSARRTPRHRTSARSRMRRGPNERPTLSAAPARGRRRSDVRATKNPLRVGRAGSHRPPFGRRRRRSNVRGLYRVVRSASPRSFVSVCSLAQLAFASAPRWRAFGGGLMGVVLGSTEVEKSSWWFRSTSQREKDGGGDPDRSRGRLYSYLDAAFQTC